LTADFEVQKKPGWYPILTYCDYRTVELSKKKLALLDEEVPVAILTFTTTENTVL
jgi:hypothetical protein